MSDETSDDAYRLRAEFPRAILTTILCIAFIIMLVYWEYWGLSYEEHLDAETKLVQIIGVATIILVLGELLTLWVIENVIWFFCLLYGALISAGAIYYVYLSSIDIWGVLFFLAGVWAMGYSAWKINQSKEPEEDDYPWLSETAKQQKANQGFKNE